MSDTDEDASHLPSDSTDVGTHTDLGTEEFEEEVEEESIESYYDPEDFISGPVISETCTMPYDMLDVDFLYGYDCKKYFNLTALDTETIVFSSGNYIIFLNVNTRKIWWRRSALGGGIGHIRRNPNPEYDHLAIAECGRNPIIIIYVWPSLDIVCILREGATKIYTNMDFSPDGELLVSQGGEPDYLITVWNWHKHKILLRTKSYVNEVYRVKFSPYVAGQLTTCGLAHIKFWKMARTFTGLKLQGELGRFGKTEYSDIIGILPMPDAKVVSGCSWGNILVWDAGLITFEICRSLRKRCHDGPITQFQYNEGELWTISMDGHVKVWWFEKIDQADPPDDDRVILVDPTYDFYTEGLMLMYIEKKQSEVPDSWWYAQDGNGGIWMIDLNTEEKPKESIQLYKCHAGKVVDIAACPYKPFFGSLGEDGRFYLYDYVRRQRIFDFQFPSRGVAMIWIPLEFSPYGDIIIMAFEDGQVRVCQLDIGAREEDTAIYTIQIIKPHHKPITAMALNHTATILVSAGEDQTIFIFSVDFAQETHMLNPIGFIPTPDIVTHITWNPWKDDVVLIGCAHGQFMEVVVPREPQNYTGVSFLLDLETKQNKFTTYKSQIKRDLKILEIETRKAIKIEKKKKEMEQIKKDNPGLEIDEETFLADSETEEELEPLFFPEVPNKIVWLKYTDEGNIWLSMAGYDSGYIYEYTIDQKKEEPQRFRLLYEAENLEISSYVYSSNHEYMTLALEDGRIRIVKLNPEDYMDLTDYWELAMHDNQNGFIPKMCYSFDEKYFFSCGYDGNVFAYKFQAPNYEYGIQPFAKPRLSPPMKVKDVDPYGKLSLEEMKLKAERDRIQKLANEHKSVVRDKLKHLKERYRKVLQKNEKLLPSQKISRGELELDERVELHVKKIFQEKLEIVKKKLEYDVEKSEVQMTKLLKYFTDPCDKHPVVINGINKPGCSLMTVRQRLMPPKYYQMFDIIAEKMKEEEFKEKAQKITRRKPPERAQIGQKALQAKSTEEGAALEYFLLSLSPDVVDRKLGPKLTRLLGKYRARKDKWEIRKNQWNEFMARKPIPGKNHPDDEKFLEEAKISFGDYKLKESADYKPPRELRETTVKQYKKLLEARGKQYDIRHSFIQKVYDVREEKYKVRERLIETTKALKLLQAELPDHLVKPGPAIPEIDPAEFPEEKLKAKIVLSEEEETEEVEKDTVIFHEEKNKDLMEKAVLPQRSTFPKMENNVFKSTISKEEVQKVEEMTFEELCKLKEDGDTPFEACLRAKRLSRKLFEQEMLLHKMQDEIDAFNNIIEVAKLERLPILIRGNFVDIFIVCVSEELNILRSYEEGEDRLAQEANDKLRAVHDIEDVLDNLIIKKEEYNHKIESVYTEEAKITEKFKSAAETNKFYDFLKKVFKKKYKPPKIRDDDESSSESSSSSEEEDYGDDDESIDSANFGYIKQDLNVCPKGCEVALFNLTVELRTKRHEMEQSVSEVNRIKDVTVKEIEVTNRKLVSLKQEYKDAVLKSEIYQREKQRKLNDVRCTVVLHLDQIYQFNPESSDISDFLVFSKSKLSDLYKRVGYLQQDTVDHEGKNETYLKHLVRMKKDMNYVRSKLKCLQKEYVHLMKEKFGKVIDINELEMHQIRSNMARAYVNELEEVALKKMVYDLRLKLTDVRASYMEEMKMWNVRITKGQTQLTEAIKENTKRLELLSVIGREKNQLEKVIEAQPKKMEKMHKIEMVQDESFREIEKLESIVQKQTIEIADLKEEIKMLKTKGLPGRIPREELEQMMKITKEDEKLQEEEEEIAKKWTDYDEYIVKDAEERKADISMPTFYSTEAEDIVTGLVEEILENIEAEQTKQSVRKIVSQILSEVFQAKSMTDMINRIVENFPSQLSVDDKDKIESTAGKLWSLQEEEQFGIEKCAKEIINNIVDEVLFLKSEAHDFIVELAEKLVETLPLDLVKQEDSISEIVSLITGSLLDKELDRSELRKSIAGVDSVHKGEIVEIVNIILERVYGEGIDYLYVIEY